ncbi:MAG: coniferyl-alcohol dehydrogenase [Pseudomonadota bacterium]
MAASGASLDGKTIVVTGSASGIGAETTALLRRRGATVLGVDRQPSDNADQFFQADLSDPASIDGLVAALPAGIDGLANIAGLPPTAPPDSVIKVNLLGLQRLTEGVVATMADGASIVNLASLAGFGWANSLAQIKAASNLSFDNVDEFVAQQGIAEQAGRSYFFSKEALIVWTLKNRWTWRDRGIRMNCVSPGPVETPILKDFIETLGERAEEDMKIMDRPGRPSDVAPVVAFLLSDDAEWFRGANLTVDGGMSSHILQNVHEL